MNFSEAETRDSVKVKQSTKQYSQASTDVGWYSDIAF